MLDFTQVIYAREKAFRGSGLPARLSTMAFLLIFSITTGFSQLSVTFNLTEPTCFGLPKGSITAIVSGGTAPYSFSWSNGETTQTITDVFAGDYTVTVIDDNGMAEVESVTLGQPDLISATLVADQCMLPFSITAFGGGGVPPYNYFWSTGETTQTISNLAPGNYCVTLTDDNLCGVVECIELNNTPISLSVVANDLTCPDSNDGSVTALPSGGTPPYSYLWNTGATTQSLTNLGPGVYAVTVTDSGGCDVSSSGVVTAPPPILIDKNVTDPVCVGDANGSIVASASGGTPPYSFFWSTGQFGQVLNNLAPGSYTVTVIDASNCEAEMTAVLEPQSTLAAGAFGTMESCPDADDGFLTATANGGQSPFTYLWSNGATTQVVTNVTPGNYSLTITDALGCEATASTVVMAAPDFDINVDGNDISTCGATNGAVFVTIVNGGTAPFDYQWSTGDDMAVVTGLPAGTYSVTVTDANDCVETGSVTITAPPDVSISINATTVICPNTNEGTATAVVLTGTPPYTYLWSNGGTTATIDNLGPGGYSVTVMDSNGCMDDASVVITESPEFTINVVGTTTVCGAGNTGSATALITSGTGNFSYLWSNGATIPSISGLAEGTYTVTVTDENGCTQTDDITIDIIDDLAVNIVKTDLDCFDDNDGTAVATPSGGTAPYTFEWNTGATTSSLANLPAGPYTVTVTDQNGCTASAAVIIGQPTQLTVTINGSEAVCEGESTGNATAIPSGGTPGYTYEWSNGETTQTIMGLAPGTYTVTVTDANECEATATIEILQSPGLEVEIDATTVLCGTGETGSADVTVMGGTPPFAYEWNTGDMTESLDDLPAGTYTVTVTDANDCEGTAEVTIQMVDDLTVDVIIRNTLCTGDTNGGALAEVSGGTAPYSYEWNTGSTADELVDIPAGTYSVTVTDFNGCTAEASGEVVDPAMLSVMTSAQDADCFGESSGMATATPIGGTAPYTIAWSNGMTGEMISGLAVGTYTVTVTDANLCTAEGMVEINQPDDLLLTVNAPTIVCGGTATGTATAIVTGGTGPYVYAWSNGGTTPTIDNLAAGIYEVTITDANGCTIDGQTFTLSELPELTLDFEVTNIICTDQNIGEISVTVNGGTPPFTYDWSTGDDGATISNLAAGTYMLTVTDANNCEATGMATVMQSLGLMVTATGTDVTCNGFNDGTAVADVMGGNGTLTYEWSNGETTASISGLMPGTYGVTVTDQDGCTGDASVTINQPDILSVSASGFDVDCNGANNGSITASASGGMLPYTYNWSNGMMGAMITGLAGGSYTVTVTDGNNCTAMTTVVINEPSDLQLLAVQLAGTCEGSTDGSANATASGGTPPYTYEWNTGATTAVLTGLVGGTYTVTATDDNGCTETATVMIEEFDAPTCVVNILSESLNGNDGSVEVVVTGGTAPFDYQWNVAGNSPVLTDLTPGTYSVTVTDANGCRTICENTLAALAGLGNYVWEDIDHDGVQDNNEPPFPDVTVHLKDDMGMIIATTTTDMNGFYSFLGLAPGTYSVQFVVPDDYRLTFPNLGGDDALDSDALPGMNGMTAPVTLSPGELDFTIDAGIYLTPYNDIDDPCNCLNNATTEDNGQFSELLTVFSYPGENWTAIEAANIFDPASLDPPAVPIPIDLPVDLVENAPGEYQLAFKLVDELTYFIRVTNGFDTLYIDNTCEYPTLNIVDLPQIDLCVVDQPFPLSASPNIPGTVTFSIDGMVVTEIDPAALGAGTFILTAELVPFDPDECILTVLNSISVIDDCSALVGDFVWNDLDQDGIQDPGEPGIPNVIVIITETDENTNTPYADTTQTDANGNYLFEVPPGTYKITFITPNFFTPSPQDQGGDDALDSDPDVVMGMTDVFTVEDGDVNLTFDAGFFNKCDNVTDPGEIGFYQFLCGPGVDPEPLVEVEAPSGGSGAFEWLWMYSTEPGPFDPNIWIIIPDSDSPTYDPGPLYETTYFARCVRRECCETYLESNIIIIEVGNVAVADINGPSLICEDEPTTYFAAQAGPGAVIEWDFGLGATPPTATGSPVDVTFASFGNFQIHLSVTENGCTSTDIKDITVTNSPTVCGTGLAIDVNVINQEYITVDWRIDMQPEPITYTIEHSSDGDQYRAIGEMTEPTLTGDGQDYYQYIHESPKRGRNYYRVRIEDADGNFTYSEVGEGIIYGESKLALLYPNPVQDQLRLELFETFDDEVTIRVIGIQGIVHETILLPADTKHIDLDFDRYPAGTYFLQLQLGKVDVKTMKVVKQ
jgi:hypothetical protein